MQAAAGETRLTFFGAGAENAAIAPCLVAEFSRVMASGQILNGPDVDQFEARIAALAGRTHAAAVNSATDALFFALKAGGVGPGDDVLVPAFSFVASGSAVLRTGARPVFVDVRAPDAAATAEGCAPCTMDLAAAERRLTSRTWGLVWVDLFGGMGDPEPVTDFAARHGLFLLEDASQSFGARFGPTPAGSFGQTSVFSFDRNKTLGAPGTGGAVLTDDPELDARVRALRYHGVGDDGFVTLGYNSQMSSVTAAVLSLKLDHHATWAARRGAIAARLDAAFGGLPLLCLAWPDSCLHVHHKYVLLCPQRSGLEAHLRAAGVPTRRHYARPLPREPVFAELVPPDARFPVAETLAAQALSLPIHAQLRDDEVERIAHTVIDFFR